MCVLIVAFLSIFTFLPQLAIKPFASHALITPPPNFNGPSLTLDLGNN